MSRAKPSVSYSTLYDFLQDRSGLPPYVVRHPDGSKTKNVDGYSSVMLAKECCIKPSTALRWSKLDRIPIDRADDVAIALGLVPRSIWKAEWDAVIRQVAKADEDCPEPGVYSVLV